MNTIEYEWKLFTSWKEYYIYEHTVFNKIKEIMIKNMNKIDKLWTISTSERQYIWKWMKST